ncbi:hypothetical protein [Falsirhodobacter sp. 20TX0035]|uniref:hypothetical protein n=1 Tax=Falsirhodobacter sp. 20TX0035 TaxID=3022019 RepID=UPI00232D9565|nr:hypothetical protein [Falsirhodobacter sp. 20TX0035]MDB6453595.1 hypothetical protein [Falsirhodobacter sp. 20TX0035]
MLGIQVGLTPSSFLSAAGAQPWTPARLDGVAAWFDASDPGTMVLDADRRVQRWTDRVGGLVWSQATAAARPVFNPSARNGGGGLVLTGGQFMTGSSGALPLGQTPHTLLVAGHSQGADTQYGGIIGWGGQAKGQSRTLQVRAKNTEIGISFYQVDIASASSWSGTERTVIHQMSGTPGNLSGRFFIDGELNGTHAITGIETVEGGSSFGANLTSQSTTVAGFLTQQVVICRTAISDADRQRLEGWVSWTSGRAGAELPATHPYKTARPM